MSPKQKAAASWVTGACVVCLINILALLVLNTALWACCLLSLMGIGMIVKAIDAYDATPDSGEEDES